MRRTKEEAEQTKQHIMIAAIKVMNKKGLGSTRFEDIAQEADVTRGAIYHYFKSKNEILFAIHDKNKKQIFEIFERHISNDIDPVISLKSGLKEIFKRFENDEEYRAIEELFLKVEFTSLIREDEELSEIFEKEKEKTICDMLELVKRGQESGSLRKDIKTENLGLALISFYVGFITTWFLQLHKFPMDGTSDDFIDVLFHGILK
jgi:TetR/AcrR family transcriptional regulator, acrAB operon repressor